MDSRERLNCCLNHIQPDKVPLDLSGHGQSGISVVALQRLRRALNFPDKQLEIFEILQLLGTVDFDILEHFGCDAVPLKATRDMFGNNTINGSKPFVMSSGQCVLVPKDAQFDFLPDGSVLAYPQGDRSVKPSACKLNNGTFFDGIFRQDDFDEDNLTPLKDYEGAFSLMDDESFDYYKQESERLYNKTKYAIVGNIGGGAIGDCALLAGAGEKNPQGIRNIQDFYMAHLLYPDYIKQVFERQTEYCLRNLERYKEAVGNRISAVWVSGTDFGTQNGLAISRKSFCELYKPFYTKINKWIHDNTSWKTLYHSCGAVYDLLDDFVEMGVDVLNPLQLSAKGMDGKTIKEKYGAKLSFWGGGVDTQKTLPFGSVQDVKNEVKERLEYFSVGGGYVFNTVHNIVADISAENIIAMYDAVNEFNNK